MLSLSYHASTPNPNQPQPTPTPNQAVLDQRAKQDVENARRRRQEATSRETQRQELEERKRAVASGRWSGVAADRSRLLRATKVGGNALSAPVFILHVQPTYFETPHGRKIQGLEAHLLTYILPTQVEPPHMNEKPKV